MTIQVGDIVSVYRLRGSYRVDRISRTSGMVEVSAGDFSAIVSLDDIYNVTSMSEDETDHDYAQRLIREHRGSTVGEE